MMNSVARYSGTDHTLIARERIVTKIVQIVAKKRTIGTEDNERIDSIAGYGLPAMCVEAQRLGLYAEVVSGMEYDIAQPNL